MTPPLRVQIRGLTIEIPASDPRATAIEAMLLAPSEPPAPEPEPPPVREPPPTSAMLFWDDLDRLDRRELLMLAEKPCTPAELEQALGLRAGKLSGRHLRVALAAKKHRAYFEIKARGRWRSGRCFYLDEETAALVKRIASLPPLS